MAKKDLKLHSFCYASTVVIASAYDENGKADACTLAFYMSSSHIPHNITIGINATQQRKTLQGILARKEFTVGFPNIHQIKELDYLGVESGYNADKLSNVGLTVTEGKAVKAPVIDQLMLSLECKLTNCITVGSHMQLTGEVANIQAEESVLNERGDKVDLSKLEPVIYNEDEFAYYTISEKKGDAFRAGAQLKKELKK